MSGPGRVLSRGGFTLAEVLVLMAVIALLASGAIALLSRGNAEVVAREAAQRVAADLVFARTEAVAGRAARSVTFFVEADAYRIQATADGTILTHPVTRRPFEVALAEIYPGAGVDLEAADFAGAATIEFDRQGRPQAGGTVTLAAGRQRFFVDVAAGSGRVTVRAPASKPAEEPNPGS